MIGVFSAEKAVCRFSVLVLGKDVKEIEDESVTGVAHTQTIIVLVGIGGPHTVANVANDQGLFTASYFLLGSEASAAVFRAVRRIAGQPVYFVTGDKRPSIQGQRPLDIFSVGG